ncbi:hypothetical protein B0T21DRAFT_115607 [Apiosordaria backusii]|uniref:Uncharacterized protein n=1 Tax=Apiosordaria backusii TaxID=314023 RepID=A0AA40DIR8_9PEZI|nr:hypothetical protein B0T21DRAFT_115607 [Apiosordaria backusii]
MSSIGWVVGSLPCGAANPDTTINRNPHSTTSVSVTIHPRILQIHTSHQTLSNTNLFHSSAKAILHEPVIKESPPVPTPVTRNPPPLAPSKKMSALLLKPDTHTRIKWWQILLIVWGILQGVITLVMLRIGHRQFLSLFPEPKRKQGGWLWGISWSVGFVLTLFWPFLLVWILWGSLDGVRSASVGISGVSGDGVCGGKGGDIEAQVEREAERAEGNGVGVKGGGGTVAQVKEKMRGLVHKGQVLRGLGGEGFCGEEVVEGL